MDNDTDRVEAEVTPEVRKLLARIRNGQALTLVENGVVVAKLERVEVGEGVVDAARVRATFEQLDALRASLERPLTQAEIAEAIAEGRM